ncbi:MAG: hypothetical protein ABEJ02_00170 [Candidatus Paceibacteria bacterium]
MNFVEKFLTKHHLIHKPHKWFLALISSPIHAAEKHYEKKYKLNYGHARKLFIFDMFLLVLVAVLIGATLFWFLYDPGVTDKVNLTISKEVHGQAVDSNRIKSGEHITYIIKYTNGSNATLQNPKLTLNLPKTFRVETVTPQKFYTTHTKTFELPDLQPGSEGSIKMEGFYFGPPGEHKRITVFLNYNQQQRKQREQIIASAINILQGSYLKANLKPKRATVLPRDNVSAELSIKNTYHHDMKNIRIPLEGADITSTTVGETSEQTWRIDQLNKQEEAKAEVSINVAAEPNTDKFTYSFTPQIQQQDKLIPQQQISTNFEVIYPKTKLSTSWDKKAVQPGDTAELTIVADNNGSITLNNLAIALPTMDKFIDRDQFLQLNDAKLQQGSFVITNNTNAKLTSLAPGQKKEIKLKVPINSYISEGEDLTLQLKPKLRSSIGQIEKSYTKSKTTAPLKIGTSISLSVSSRYFTPGGDQLGRGPLPPRVGETTKYWVFVTFRNTTSDIENISFRSTLSESARWTGKTSVSQGENLNFNQQDKTVSWSYPQLPPHSKAGLYMQLAVTPEPKHRGTTPNLLENIRLKADDSYINRSITKTSVPIDTSLPQDDQAQQLGVEVR